MKIINIDNYILYLLILSAIIWQSPTIFFQFAFIAFVILLILIIKSIKIAISGKLFFTAGSFDLPILLVSISYILSTIFSTPSKMDAVISPGTTTIILLGAIIYFLVNQISLSEKRSLTSFMIAGLTIHSTLILLSIAKIIPWMLPEGAYFASVLFIIPLLPITVNVIFKQKDFAYKLLAVISLFITIFALSILIYKIIFNKNYSPKYPSFKISANIALQTLKKNPILGIGSGNYLESFNKYRSFDYNKTNIWAAKFNQGSSFLITNLTEIGILGSFAFLSLIAIFVNKAGWGLIQSLNLLSVTLNFVILVFFPSSPILIVTLFILLGLTSESKKHEYSMPTRIASLFVLLPLLVLISLANYKIYIATLAEYKYSQALKSLETNNAKAVYDKLKQAINLNSDVPQYHKVLSSVYFAMANSVSQKNDLTDQNKEQATLFVQESINEAKAVVALNNKNSENWQFLGKTYYLLIPFAKGADQFAINSYKEAINFDPINPNLRIALGEVYMLQKDYKNAIETFNLAVLAKDDLPNAHFNLAVAYRENKELDKAKNEINITLKLLNRDSKDFEIASKELRAIEELLKLDSNPS